MSKESWSYSKIDTFKTCPFKFYLQYWKKIKEPDANLAAMHKGSLVHLLLEQKLTGDVDLEDKELRDLLDKLAKEDITKTLRSVKKFIEGEFWASLNPDKASAEQWIYLDKTLSPCVKLDAFVIGKVDYIEKKEDYVLIIDWKTGKKTNKELAMYKSNCLQLDIYALWALQKYPEFESVNAMLYYIETHAMLEKIYSKANIDELKNKVAKEILEVRNTKEFERKLGPLCDYCGYFSQYCNNK